MDLNTPADAWIVDSHPSCGNVPGVIEKIHRNRKREVETTENHMTPKRTQRKSS